MHPLADLSAYLDGAREYLDPRNTTTIAAPRIERETTGRSMWLILLEAFGALVVLLLIVWWTMFRGRRRGERE